MVRDEAAPKTDPRDRAPGGNLDRATLEMAGAALLAASAPVALLLTAVLYAGAVALGKVVWRVRIGLMILAGLGLLWVALMGPRSALFAYTEVYRAVAATFATDPQRVGLVVLEGWARWVVGMLPLSLPAAAIAAAGAHLLRERRRSARPAAHVGPRPGLLAPIRARRVTKQLQRGDEARLEGAPLGVDDDGRAVVLDWGELNRHTLVVGAAGSGKTTTLERICSAFARRELPIVLIDLKGDPEVVERLRSLSMAHGRAFRLWTLAGPSRWNPLRRGDPSELKDKLIGLEEWTEPHYRRAAERYLQSLFTALAQLQPEADLGQVVDLLDSNALAVACRSLPSPLAQRILGYIGSLSKDQQSAIRGLQARLAVLAESTAGPLLRTGSPAETIDLLRSVRAGEVVLFSLDSAKYPGTAAQLGGVVIQDLKCVGAELLAEGWRGKALVAVDEFSALEGTHLLGLVARGRSSGLCVLLATQELADLAAHRESFLDQVLGNTAVKVVHRQDVPRSAEILAGVAGTDSAWEETVQVLHGRSWLAARRHEPTGLGTLRKVEHYVVHPNQLKRLEVGQAVVIRKYPAARVQVVRVVRHALPTAGLQKAGERREPAWA